MFGRILLCLSVACTVVACGDDDNDHGGGSDDSPEETGQQCGVADDCFIDLRGDDGIQGEAVCLDRVEGGYCTHTCATDADCCAVDGECETDLRQVCAPFENTDMMKRRPRIPLANQPASCHSATSDKPIAKPDLPGVLTVEVPPQRGATILGRLPTVFSSVRTLPAFGRVRGLNSCGPFRVGTGSAGSYFAPDPQRHGASYL